MSTEKRDIMKKKENMKIKEQYASKQERKKGDG